jgi:hypothetical protein
MLPENAVLELAAREDFDLHERLAAYMGEEAWGWHRGDDDRWPCFVERGQAISWMADRLRRAGAFRQLTGCLSRTVPERAIGRACGMQQHSCANAERATLTRRSGAGACDATRSGRPANEACE